MSSRLQKGQLRSDFANTLDAIESELESAMSDLEFTVKRLVTLKDILLKKEIDEESVECYDISRDLEYIGEKLREVCDALY